MDLDSSRCASCWAARRPMPCPGAADAAASHRAAPAVTMLPEDPALATGLAAATGQAAVATAQAGLAVATALVAAAGLAVPTGPEGVAATGRPLAAAR